MTVESFVVEKDFLLALANRIFRYGRKVLLVRSPPLKLVLLRIDQRFRVTGFAQPRAYWRDRDQAVRESRAADRETPQWEDLAEALRASGAVPPRNWDSFLRWLHDLRSEASDPQRIARPVGLAVDTNVAYHRLFMRHLGPEAPTVRGFTVLVSQGVRDEVDYHIGRKASRAQMQKLYRAPRLASYLEELANRNALETRKAKLAQNELDYLTSRRRALTVPCGPFTGNKERFDVEIARSYAAFAEENGMDAYLLTFDQNMGDRAKNAGIPRFLLEIPDVDTFRGVSLERAFPSLLHDLAVLFGVIVVEPFEVLVWGEWRGKTTADYEAEKVRVDVDARHPFVESFARDADLGRLVLGLHSGATK